MEYQKIINLLGNTSNQPSKFTTKNWVEIIGDSRGNYNTDTEIKFKTLMLISSLCDHIDAYILVKGRITINGTKDVGWRQADEGSKGVILKYCAPFTDCISEINNTQVDNATYLDVVMPMYNLIEYCDNYSKTFRSLWEYHRDKPNDNLTDSESFKLKVKIKRKYSCNTKDVEMAELFNYFSNFWRTLEMLLINCEINFVLT